MDKQCKEEQSNKDIIDDLTRDLETSCIKKEENTGPPDDNADSEDRKSALGDVYEDAIGEPDNTAKSSSSAEDATKLPDDFIDEVLLKDREVNLSESEKEELKEEAEKLKNEGNELFKNESYTEAISKYTEGLRTCSLAYNKERSILYANRAAAKSKSLEKTSAIEDCTKAIELNPDYVKAYIRRAQLYEETEKLDEALEDYKKILSFDPAHSDANYAVRRLPPMIEERNEKLKTEMLGKLKDLGNMILKPFGLSTNNFELQKDPNSGGYSVKFNQNSS